MAISNASTALIKTPLYDLHIELGARMVPFAGYALPVQYPAGLISEHKHTRSNASLFDVSHMGQISITGTDAALAMESLIPANIVGLKQNHQRYGLLLNHQGCIMDDLMMVNRKDDLFTIVNGACKYQDLAYIQQHIGKRCNIKHLTTQALLALQGPKAIDVIKQLANKPIELVFMTGDWFKLAGIPCYMTRSGYTGEDGFEISVDQQHAQSLARTLLSHPEVMPAGLGARNSLRLEAGLCLYGNDMDDQTTPTEAGLLWSIPKIRTTNGQRAGDFPGAKHVLAQIDQTVPITRKRVGLIALERVPVREGSTLHTDDGQQVGVVTSGLLGPTIDRPIAMGYLPPDLTLVGTRIYAQVRNKSIPMEVAAMPFVAQRYYRG